MKDIHKLLHQPGLAQEIVSLLDSKEAALAFLQQEADDTTGPDVGPVRIGTIAALRDPKIWRTVAARYALAFAQKSELLPYFSDVS